MQIINIKNGFHGVEPKNHDSESRARNGDEHRSGNLVHLWNR
jgi:hypothetical protein